ncbi:uncharacterized protein LOC144641311 [Oculina patagonica]
MCNEEGKCSSPTEPYPVKEVKDITTSSQNGGELSRKQIALIAVSVVGCLLFAVYVIRKWRRGEIREVFNLVLLRDRVVLHVSIHFFPL